MKWQLEDILKKFTQHSKIRDDKSKKKGGIQRETSSYQESKKDQDKAE